MRKSVMSFTLLSLLIAILNSEDVHEEDENLIHKIFCGYQAWFTASLDGSQNGWTHYKMNSSKPFAKNNCVIDLWPDTTEYQHVYSVPQFGNGYSLFSPNDYSTVAKHFQWMKNYGIDGIFLQRFGSDIRNKDSNLYKFKNNVFEHVMKAASENDRFWVLMYDLSGLKSGQIRSVILEDWQFLNNQYHFLDSIKYVKHKGKPLISIWGIGFNDNRQYTFEQCKELILLIKKAGCSVMLGVSTYWREGGRDTVTGDSLKKLHELILLADVVSPWSVGRYETIANAQAYSDQTLLQDIKWLDSYGITMMPVIFPGFSWHNLQASGENPQHPGPYNQIPRKQKGEYFLEVQGISDIRVGAKTLYVAMFDQMNEGTSIFKCSKNPPSLSDGLKFVPYEEEPDFYLKMVGDLGRRLSNISKLNTQVKQE